MTRDELPSRISIDPNICFGEPCIRGHRIWVSLILDLLASGDTVETVLENYPGLETADILACIAYGAREKSDINAEITRGLADVEAGQYALASVVMAELRREFGLAAE